MRITDYAALVVDYDWTPAFNQAVLDCVSSGCREIVFPYAIGNGDNGNYRFKTRPNPIPCGITLRGENPRQWLIRHFSDALADVPFIHYDGSLPGSNADARMGGGIVNLGLYANDGTVGGTALRISGQSYTQRPGYMRFENVVVSGGGTWHFGLMIKGQNIATSGSKGIRDITFDTLYLFRCTGDAGHITNGVHVFLDHLNVADGGAGLTSPMFRINGLGSSLTNSEEVFLTACDIAGTLVVENAKTVVASGYTASLIAYATATGLNFRGLRADSVAVPAGVVVG